MARRFVPDQKRRFGRFIVAYVLIQLGQEQGDDEQKFKRAVARRKRLLKAATKYLRKGDETVEIRGGILRFLLPKDGLTVQEEQVWIINGRAAEYLV